MLTGITGGRLHNPLAVSHKVMSCTVSCFFGAADTSHPSPAQHPRIHTAGRAEKVYSEGLSSEGQSDLSLQPWPWDLQAKPLQVYPSPLTVVEVPKGRAQLACPWRTSTPTPYT